MAFTILNSEDIERITVGDEVDRNGEHTEWFSRTGHDGEMCQSSASAGNSEFGDYAGHGYCSRKEHERGTLHVAIGIAAVCGTWRTEAGGPGVPAADAVEDPNDAPLPDVTPGNLVRLKGRRTLLFVVADKRTKTQQTKIGGDVSVLDLSNDPPRLRVISHDRLVERREEDVPTPGQLKSIAVYMAGRREVTRGIALQEKRTGRFKSADEVNKVLDEMGLEPYKPERSGRGQIEFRVYGPDSATRTEARRIMEEALRQVRLPAGWRVQDQASSVYDFDRT